MDLQYSNQDIKIIYKKTVYHGFFQIQIYRLRHRLFTGKWSEEIERELFERGNAVAVLLYDPRRDQIVITEQFRIGAINDSRSPWLFELVAGIIEEGESAEVVAIRESYEEAGCEIQKVIPICRYYSSPGGSSEILHLYCGFINADQVVVGVHGLSEESENIKIHLVDRSVAFELVKSGKINNAATIIAIQWLQLNKDFW